MIPRLSVWRGDRTLQAEALDLRIDIVEALYATGGGHYGGCLSVIDLLLVLYRRQLRVDPAQPRDPLRDRLILSKGHAALALYAVLRRLGYFETPLTRYAELGSPLEGHPDMLALPGVDFSTGSLGQGLSVGVGMAHALRGGDQRVWVVLGDGECQEGQVWEAAMLGAMCRLGRLHAVIDHNRHQEWGWGEDMPPVPALAEKWRAFGWRVFECDGHDHGAFEAAIAAATAAADAPSVIIADTIKGRGVPLCEADVRRFHCDAASAEEHRMMIEALRVAARAAVQAG
ncbi:MAG: transketolase [Lysobacteraceae bacterium]|nr:MAG: transketolase [Xanthomonadaceae bacterium]